ncbi:MAG: hypothetical protein ABIP33_06335 [Pseudolysinimonas sp.]
MAGYAAGTEVPAERTQAELVTLLRKRGADSIAAGMTQDAGVIQFEAEGRQVRFTVPMPDPASRPITHSKTGIVRTDNQVRTARAAEERRRWRALLLVVRAKFEAIDSEIVTFEAEFLAQTVLPDNQTVLDHVREPIARAYIEGHVRPLLQLGN